MKTDSDMEGFLLIDKPEGPTSMAVVSRIRHILGKKRCGHGGTLDPLATGLLVIGVGRATKKLDQITNAPKRYLTKINLSCFTKTDDREGDEMHVSVSRKPTHQLIETTLDKFRGKFLQRPPAYSAIKIKGIRSYKLARNNIVSELPQRETETYEIKIKSYSWPYLDLEIFCQKGFYVRSLARELGEVLGTGGCCHSIRRISIGSLSVNNAIKFEDIPGVFLKKHFLDIQDFNKINY